MKEALVFKGPKVEIHDVDLPQLPSPNYLIIKVAVSGSNPKDWAVAELGRHGKSGFNTGDDVAGTVHSIGDNVKNFKIGDRVASFHEMLTPGGSFAEYAVGREESTFHLPPDVSFEEGATIPLAGMTAALGMYQRLNLPLPWNAAQERRPLIVYGGAGAVGAYAIKLATLSNIHPIIAVAGRGKAYVETLIDRSKGDVVIDYRDGNESVVEQFKKALNPGEKITRAFDAVTDKGSYQNIMQVMCPKKGKMAIVLARKKYEGVPEGFPLEYTQVGKVHGDHYPGLKGQKKKEGLLGDQEFGPMMFKFFERGLAKGWFKPHPYEVVPGGLNGVQKGLSDLKAGKASARKFVFVIDPSQTLAKPKI